MTRIAVMLGLMLALACKGGADELLKSDVESFCELKYAPEIPLAELDAALDKGLTLVDLTGGMADKVRSKELGDLVHKIVSGSISMLEARQGLRDLVTRSGVGKCTFLDAIEAHARKTEKR